MRPISTRYKLIFVKFSEWQKGLLAMLFRTSKEENVQNSQADEVIKHKENGTDITRKEDLRRLMYERISQGNSLAEAEENARYKWHGK